MTQTKYRILILGDFHFGESYSSAGAKILKRNGYQHSLKHLKPFVKAADHFVVNLETPIVDPTLHPSPLRGQKKYLHWADPAETPQQLKKLGVDAVSLANNHTLDHGEEGLLSTFEKLKEVDIPWFGAGRTLAEARKPHVISLPEEVGGGEIHLHGTFQYSRAHDIQFGFYAKEDKPGCAPLSQRTRMASLSPEPKAYSVAFPHWGANYNWMTGGQRRLTDKLLGAGYNLVLGHGSHCVQEIQRHKNNWAVAGIGNGNFQSGGRFDQFIATNDIIPFGFWTFLDVIVNRRGARNVTLNLYPVYSDNKKTQYIPGPVSAEDFTDMVERLEQQTEASEQFNNQDMRFGLDELGHHIVLELGSWPEGDIPEGLATMQSVQELRAGSPIEAEVSTEAKTGSSTPRTYTDRTTQKILAQYAKGRNLGALLGAVAAENGGSSVKWFASGIAIASRDGRSYLINGYKCDESDLGARIVQDKYLLKKFLQRAGVPTPDGGIAATVEEAVALFKKLGSPVVVKPRSGHKGQGISVNLKTAEDVSRAFGRAKAIGASVLVEEFIDPSEEYRCLSTQDRCVSVVKRLLPNVTGDGKRTIRELIEKKNEERKQNPALFKRPTPIDEVTSTFLAEMGYDLDVVLPPERKITVRNVGGLSSGGEPHECFEQVDDRVRSTSADAVRAVPGLTWGGVDLITSAKTGDPYIIEINSDADISGAMYPLVGEPKDIAGIMRELRISGELVPELSVRTPQPQASPYKVSEDASASFNGGRIVDGVFGYLRGEGCRITKEGPGIFRADDAGVPPTWLTSEAMGARDLSAVRRVVRRHSTVRRILRDAEIPVAFGAVVRSPNEVSELLSSRESGFVLLPSFRGEWGAATSRFFNSLDDFHSSNGEFMTGSAWILQEHLRSTSLRVVSTRDRLLVCLGNMPILLSVDLMHRIGEVAVSAVRAIPELRWAAVDLQLGRNSALGDADGSALEVEGLTVNPTIGPDHYVLGGSLNNCFEEIALGLR